MFLFPGLQAVPLCLKVEKALDGFSEQVFPEKQFGVLKLFLKFLFHCRFFPVAQKHVCPGKESILSVSCMCLGRFGLCLRSLSPPDQLISPVVPPSSPCIRLGKILPSGKV